MAKSDVEMVPGTTIRIPVAVPADAILGRGKSMMANMKRHLERRAEDQGVHLVRLRMTQDRGADCCVLMADVVEGPGLPETPPEPNVVGEDEV